MPVKNSHSWLIVTYFANESGMACSHHIDDRLEYLQGKGIDITILSTVCVTKLKGFKHLRVPSISPSGIRFELRQFLKRRKLSRPLFKFWETIVLLPIYPFYFLEKVAVNIDTTWFWIPAAVARGYLRCLSSHPGLLYSTGGSIATHIVAGMLARLTGIRWIAEFQDPLIHSYCARSTLELKMVKWAERYICARAAKVVFLTGEAMANTSARTDIDDRGVVIYPGAHPQTRSGVEHHGSGFLRFVHFGSLGGSRNLGSFLGALQEVFTRRQELVRSVKLSLYGSIGRDVRRQLDQFPAANSVEVHGVVSRKESIAAMQSSDLLLLIQNEEDISTETIPSKAYEYFHYHRPIFGLVYRNKELAGMLDKLGHMSVDISDRIAVSVVILAYYEQWHSGRLQLATFSSPFTIHSAVDSLLKVAENH